MVKINLDEFRKATKTPGGEGKPRKTYIIFEEGSDGYKQVEKLRREGISGQNLSRLVEKMFKESI